MSADTTASNCKNGRDGDIPLSRFDGGDRVSDSNDGHPDAIPRQAYRLGVDGDGRTHYHRPGRPEYVWVVDDGELIHDQGLGADSISAWVDHVDDHYGWRERQRVEQPAGEALVETLLAGLQP